MRTKPIELRGEENLSAKTQRTCQDMNQLTTCCLKLSRQRHGEITPSAKTPPTCEQGRCNDESARGGKPLGRICHRMWENNTTMSTTKPIPEPHSKAIEPSKGAQRHQSISSRINKQRERTLSHTSMIQDRSQLRTWLRELLSERSLRPLVRADGLPSGSSRQLDSRTHEGDDEGSSNKATVRAQDQRHRHKHWSSPIRPHLRHQGEQQLQHHNRRA